MLSKRYRVVTDKEFELRRFYFKINAERCAKDWNEDILTVVLNLSQARIEKL